MLQDGGPVDEDTAAPYWHRPAGDVLRALAGSPGGLSGEEAAARLERIGSNRLEGRRREGSLRLLVRQFENPIILILAFASLLAFFLGDAVDAWIILAIILLSGLLGFWREHGAANAIEALRRLVRTEVEVRRESRIVSVPLEEIVPGDLVVLNAGDLVPGDALILESKDLLVDEAVLTGEAYPVEKECGVVAEQTPLALRTNCLFTGTHVVSGTAEALVVHTGADTELGRISKRLRRPPAQTSFERGLNRFGFMLIRATAVFLVVIFVVNLALARPFVDSLLFSLALAVGLTPQLLPAIVSISLSEGARRMARERVIVKRLDAIEDLGSMDVLCTDKTGTVTEGSVRLAAAIDLDGADSTRVLRYARLNAGLQLGFQNPIDTALLAGGSDDASSVRRLDEIPYDFRRKRLSVLVEEEGRSVLIVKGAVASVLAVSSSAERPDGSSVAVEVVRDRIEQRVRDLSADGYRVLAVARRELGSATEVGVEDEAELTLLGLLAFFDPPKLDSAETLAKLSALGVSVRLVTGDSLLAAAHIAAAIGLDGSRVVSGEEIGRLDEDARDRLVLETRVFAEVDPEHKEQIIHSLRRGGHVVGFLGDGINDAPALHAADVGISVDTAVDVARDSAAIVMLDRGLEPVVHGVSLGRQTFANTQKYAFTTISANFGNMLSMAAASVVLPFLPLLPRQILLTNFLSDIPAMTIAADRVDPELTERPQRWNIGFVRDFMIVFGLVSSVFDVLTFVTMRTVFDASAELFRSAWFVESVITELTVLLVLRTRRPFYRSRPGRGLLLSSIGIGVLTLWLPFSPLADPLGLTSLSVAVLLALAAITAGYIVSAECAKRVFYRRKPSTRDSLPAPSAGRSPILPT
jgi:Mg2+-importing ATPase